MERGCLRLLQLNDEEYICNLWSKSSWTCPVVDAAVLFALRLRIINRASACNAYPDEW